MDSFWFVKRGKSICACITRYTFVFIKKGEYDRIDNTCFDDRQEAQRTVENVRSKWSQARVQDQVENRVICQSQNNILKVQVNINKENLKYIIKEGSCV